MKIWKTPTIIIKVIFMTSWILRCVIKKKFRLNVRVTIG
jgi:hypothetical protein